MRFRRRNEYSAFKRTTAERALLSKTSMAVMPAVDGFHRFVQHGNQPIELTSNAATILRRSISAAGSSFETTNPEANGAKRIKGVVEL
jgi:hypothetical protein